jgi:hypothetical protein
MTIIYKSLHRKAPLNNSNEQAKIYIYWNLIIKIQMRVWCVEKEMFTGVLMWSVLAIFSGLCVLTLLIDCLFLIIIHSVTVWHENININMIQNVHPRFLVGFELFNGMNSRTNVLSSNCLEKINMNLRWKWK